MHYSRVYSQDILSDRKYSVFYKYIVIYYLHETKEKNKELGFSLKSQKGVLL